MKQPPMFWKLLRDWTAMPKVLDNCIARGDAAREPMPGFVPLKGLSGFSRNWSRPKRMLILLRSSLQQGYQTIPPSVGIQCISVRDEPFPIGSTARSPCNVSDGVSCPEGSRDTTELRSPTRLFNEAR